jgi:hypothetical protein
MAELLWKWLKHCYKYASFPYFWLEISGDKNGGLKYFHLQNSTTAWNILTKFGMVVENRMLEDRDTCFLSGSVHKLR